MSEKLTESEIETALGSLSDWDLVHDAIGANYTFANFRSAFAFMTEVAFAVEAVDHHPEWSNTYNTVSIKLTTHDVGGITKRDIDLAQHISAVANKYTAK